MTLQEFRAWLEGFSEAMGEAPTLEQWAKIKAKLATVEALRVSPGFTVPGIDVNPYRSPTSIDPQWAEPRVTCDSLRNLVVPSVHPSTN